MRVQWNESLAVGNTTIDTQHKELFAKVDALLDAMKHGQGRKRLTEVLGFLEQYVVFHFAAEERLMQESRYPDLAKHKKIHADFVIDFLTWKQRIETSPMVPFDLVFELQERLSEWLVEHIGETDRAVAAFLGTAAAPQPKRTCPVGSVVTPASRGTPRAGRRAPSLASQAPTGPKTRLP